MLKIICSACGEERESRYSAMCERCYRRIHARSHPRPMIVCSACGERRRHAARGMCARCYQRLWRAGLKNSGCAIRQIAAPPIDTAFTKPAADKPSVRVCLRCGREFKSEGWSNRICESCNNVNSHHLDREEAEVSL